MLNPASGIASRIASLTSVTLWIAAGVFVLVEALLLFVVFRFRHRMDGPLPKQVTGNQTLEIAWTAFPALVLAVVFVLTVSTLMVVDTPPAAAGGTASDPTQALTIKVIGHQWWWEFQYPDQGIKTANELHVPINGTVYLDLTSADVIHSFWVPELGHKIDALPNHINHLWFTAHKVGRFDGQCGEFCGAEHALMHIQVVVETPDQFNAWLKGQKAPIPADLTGEAAVGQQMFLNAQCPVCHSIQGTKANGAIGPDLTHFASRAKFAGATFDNNHANVSQWIQHPSQMKPGTVMPDLGPMPNMGNSIATFLEQLK